MADPTIDPKTIQRFEELHAIVQANKLIAYSERGDDRHRANDAFTELNELLDETILAQLDRAQDLLEADGADRRDEVPALLKELSGLRRFKKFRTLWDVDHGR